MNTRKKEKSGKNGNLEGNGTMCNTHCPIIPNFVVNRKKVCYFGQKNSLSATVGRTITIFGQ